LVSSHWFLDFVGREDFDTLRSMRVALFTTCLAEALAPRALKAAVLVLEHCGVAVEMPSAQTCCGQPMLSNGLPADAALLARRMSEIFAPYDAVVTPSGSCCSVVREKYAGLFAEGSRDRAAVEVLAAKTYELVEFLETRLGIDPATLRAETCSHASTASTALLTCHDACHLRGLHRHGCTAPFLKSAGCGDVRDLPDMAQCCGFGGMFSTQFPEVSTALGEEKLAHIASTGASTLVASDTGCAAHLAGLAHRKGVALRVISPAEALAESLGLLEVSESGAPNGGKV
jgi:L-lactate dehydrogenase complex protein LldE